MKLLFLLLASPLFAANPQTNQQGALTPVAAWHLNELSGTIMMDNAGGIVGTANGTTLVNPCLVGACRSFNGSTDHIDTNVSATANFEYSDPFSVVAWYKDSGSANAQATILTKFKNDGDGTRGWWFLADGAMSDVFVFGFHFVGGGYKYAKGTSDVQDNKWHFLVATSNCDAVTCDYTKINLYVDGVKETSSVWYEGGSPAGSVKVDCGVTFGARTNTCTTIAVPGIGYIEGAAIYNRILSLAEIQYLYQSKAKVYQ